MCLLAFATSLRQVCSQRSEYEGLVPRLGPFALLDLNDLLVRTHKLALSLPKPFVATAPGAHLDLDAITVEGAATGLLVAVGVAWRCCYPSFPPPFPTLLRSTCQQSPEVAPPTAIPLVCRVAATAQLVSDGMRNLPMLRAVDPYCPPCGCVHALLA
jgi:hypothetical protein